MRKTKHLIEYIAIYPLYALFRLLPLDWASATGGFIGRGLGHILSSNRKALRHLSWAFPEKTPQEHKAISLKMWENLGRIFAEYPHLNQIADQRIEFEGLDNIPSEPDAPAVLFGAHLGNWEILCPTFTNQFNTDIGLIYRAPNNPFVDALLNRARSKDPRVKTIPKSKTGSRAIYKTLKNGNKIGILIDQKYNEGEAFPFFGRPAMTSSAFVELALRFDCPLVPIRVIRTQGAKFKVVCYPPLRLFNKDGEQRPMNEVILEAHQMLEEWITENPEQWLWLHKRWSSAESPDPKRHEMLANTGKIT